MASDTGDASTQATQRADESHRFTEARCIAFDDKFRAFRSEIARREAGSAGGNDDAGESVGHRNERFGDGLDAVSDHMGFCHLETMARQAFDQRDAAFILSCAVNHSVGHREDLGVQGHQPTFNLVMALAIRRALVSGVVAAPIARVTLTGGKLPVPSASTTSDGTSKPVADLPCNSSNVRNFMPLIMSPAGITANDGGDLPWGASAMHTTHFSSAENPPENGCLRTRCDRVVCIEAPSCVHRADGHRRVPAMSYVADPARYDAMQYRRCGRSGLLLPAISLGLWHNFGDDRAWTTQRDICRRAFDLGVTHFDLANNYGPPYGAAEANFGRILACDLGVYRDELIISTKAGYDMWPGPYGNFGSRKYLIASLDQSLQRMGLDYVDIFYSHRADPDTPIEETVGALASVVQQGKALYVGISSYSSARSREAARLLAELKVPLLIHQPSYSLFNRWTEDDHLLDALEELGAGCIAFSPLAQGLLTNRYLNGIPADSRAATGGALAADSITEERLGRVRALNTVAERRGQSLAQLALVWALRDPRMTSLVIGASSVNQLEDNVAALKNMELSADELAEIERYALDADINLWQQSSQS